MTATPSATEIILRPFEEDDLSLVWKWVNSDFVRDAVGTVRPISMVQHRRWYAALQEDSSRLALIIEDGASTHAVGLIGLSNIDLTYRNAEIWIYLGDTHQQRRGVGRAAVTQMLRMAFDTLGLHRIYAHVFAFNETAHRFFLACGFQEEGRLREAVFKKGAFHDKLVLGILSRETHGGAS